MKKDLKVGQIFYYGSNGLPVMFAGYLPPDAPKEAQEQTAYFVCENWHHYQFYWEDIYDTPIGISTADLPEPW